MAIEYPQPGWVQQDASAIWQAVRECIDECLTKAGSPALAAIGISNQRETGVAWERASGAPIGPAVTWQCRRSADLCERLRAEGRAPEITARTGLPVDPMFTAGKLRWLLDAAPDGQARAAAGELCVGTVDSWLLWNLTGRRRPTAPTSATPRARSSWTSVPVPGTLAFARPSACRWRRCRRSCPRARSSARAWPSGRCRRACPSARWSAIRTPHSSARPASSPARVKATYGTGSSLMMPTPRRLEAGGGLASTIAWGLDTIVYALEGNIYVTGAAVQWVADFAGLASPGAVADLAAGCASTEGVYLVPAFVGLGAPHWDDAARGLVSGLTRGSSLAQLSRAAVESIAYQVRDVFDVMQARQRRVASGPAGRRRRHPQRAAHAVPGRHPGRARAAQQHAGAVGHGRGLPGRPGHRRVGLHRRDRRPAALGGPLRAAHG